MNLYTKLTVFGILTLLFVTPIEARLEVFGSFESDDELSQIQGSEGVQFSRSTDFPAWGPTSLETKFPSGGGELIFEGIPEDWGWQEALLLYVWSDQAVPLGVRLVDALGNQFSEDCALRRGANHIQVSLLDVGSLNSRQMRSLIISSSDGGRFYFDYFALDRAHPVLTERGRWDARYSMEVETPHVKWAKPLDGGPIKAFILSPVRDGRGSIELAQRLDLDFKATSLGRSAGINKWGFGDFYRQRSPGGEFWGQAFNLAYAYIADDLLNGPEYDVIIWPGLHPWENFPKQVRSEILRRVKEGTGLVLLYPLSRENSDSGGLWDVSPLADLPIPPSGAGEEELSLDKSPWQAVGDHYITRGLDLGLFPWGQLGVVPAKAKGEVLLRSAEGNPVIAVGQFGNGHVVAFSYPQKGMLPEIDNIWETGVSFPYWEYMWPMLVRSTIWAAGRDSQAGISSIKKDQNQLFVHLAGVHAGSVLQVRMTDEFGEEEEKWSLAAIDGQNELQLPSGLQGGLHLLDLRLLGNEGVLDSAAFSFRTPRPVEITSIEPVSDRVKLGEVVTTDLTFNSDVSLPCRIDVRLFDNWDRVIDAKKFDKTLVGNMTERVSLSSDGVLTHLAKVDVEVTVKGIRSHRRSSEVFVLQPREWDDYDIAMYRFGSDPMPGVWPVIDRQMRRMHVSTLAAYSLEHSRHANYDIQAQTRISGVESPDGARRNYYSNMKRKYLETKDKKVLVREYCFHDPSYQDLVKEELARMLPPWVPFSPTSYYVYEEPSLTCYGDAVDICFSEHTMAAMRDWLKKKYQTLDLLNDTWGTEFASWSEVLPDDTYEARARGNYASWADHRRFMELTYAASFKFVLDELRRYDPEGILLNSGTQISGSHNGTDYSLMNQYTEHLNAYSGGNQLDFHRNFNPDLKISGGAGYGVLGKNVLYNFYSNLFKGTNAGAYIFWEYSSLDPDLTLCQSGLDMAVGFKEMRGEGIGKLVGLGAPDNHGIAIHYSYPSIHGSWIVDGEIREESSSHTSRTFDRYGENRDGWVKILKDSGFQFDFISYGDVENNQLIEKQYKVFVLPMSVALSDREVEAIRLFVREGGVLIADALPGVMDELNRFRSPRALADVFGIEARRASAQDIIAMSGEPQLELSGATPMSSQDRKPTLLQHSLGQGKAYLLNYFLDEYPIQKQEGENQAALARLNNVLDAAGVQPKIRLYGEDGKAAVDVSMYFFINGNTRLLGLLPDQQKQRPEEIRVAFDDSAAIYDVRRREFLGTGKGFQKKLTPSLPELFAMVEKPVAGLSIQGTNQANRGEKISFSFSLHGPTTLRSVATLRVIDPSGQPVDYYGGNLDVLDSAGSGVLQLALNDTAGMWKLEITDVISGVSDTLSIVVN